MGFAEFLTQYGYVAVFFGTLVEGESVLVLGGYAAYRGFLELPWVLLTAFCAAVVADQLYFHLGRRHGHRLIATSPRLKAKTEAALRLFEHHSVLTVLVMRFLWGLRIALPLAIGMSRMSALRYLALDVVAAAVWAVIFGALGFGASRLFARVIEDVHRYDAWIAAVLVLAPVVFFGVRWWWLSAVRPRSRERADQLK